MHILEVTFSGLVSTTLLKFIAARRWFHRHSAVKIFFYPFWVSGDGAAMTSKTKGYIFIAFFSVSVILFFLLSHFPVGCRFFNSFGIFRHEHDNFIFLMIVFVLVSYVITEIAVYADRFAARMSWHTPKIGKILVSQRYITQEELYQALKEQNLRIGAGVERDPTQTKCPRQLHGTRKERVQIAGAEN